MFLAYVALIFWDETHFFKGASPCNSVAKPANPRAMAAPT